MMSTLMMVILRWVLITEIIQKSDAYKVFDASPTSVLLDVGVLHTHVDLSNSLLFD